MPTGWYWQEDGIEQGPISFQELVSLVREVKLDELDLVRPEYAREWQPAYRIVGLYHMAGRVAREPVPESTLPDSTGYADAIESNEVDETLTDASGQDLDTWLQQSSLEDATTAGPGTKLSRIADAYQMDAEAAREMFSKDESAIQAAINAASEHLDRRKPVRSVLRWASYLKPSDSVLRQFFRIAMGIMLGSVVIIGIHHWSQTELQRYPDPQLMQAQIQLFPFWGPATGWEYWFLLIDTGLIAGLVGYITAKLVETVTVD